MPKDAYWVFGGIFVTLFIAFASAFVRFRKPKPPEKPFTAAWEYYQEGVERGWRSGG